MIPAKYKSTVAVDGWAPRNTFCSCPCGHWSIEADLVCPQSQTRLAVDKTIVDFSTPDQQPLIKHIANTSILIILAYTYLLGYVTNHLRRRPLFVRKCVRTGAAHDDLTDAHTTATLATHGCHDSADTSGYQAGLGFVERGLAIIAGLHPRCLPHEHNVSHVIEQDPPGPAHATSPVKSVPSSASMIDR